MQKNSAGVYVLIGVCFLAFVAMINRADPVIEVTTPAPKVASPEPLPVIKFTGPTMRCTIASAIGLGSIINSYDKRGGGQTRLALDLVDGNPRDEILDRQLIDLDSTIEETTGEPVELSPADELLIYEHQGEVLVVGHAPLTSMEAKRTDGTSDSQAERYTYEFPYTVVAQPQLQSERWNLVILLDNEKKTELAFPGTQCQAVSPS